MNVDEAFSIISVPRDITIKDLKIKYKKLVLQYHPDRNHTPEALKQFTPTKYYKITIEEVPKGF